MNYRTEDKKPSKSNLMSWLVKSPKKEIKPEANGSQRHKNAASTECEASSPAKRRKIE